MVSRWAGVVISMAMFGAGGCTGTADAEPSNITVKEESPLAEAVVPVSGFWQNPARPGWSLHVSRNIYGVVPLFWATYTPEGAPIWYLAEARSENGSFTGQLYNVCAVDNPDSRPPILRGTLTLVATSPTTGLLTWVVDGQKGSERVEYNPVNHNQMGSAPSMTGLWDSGLAFEAHGNELVAMMTACEGKNPIWLTGSGFYDGAAFSIPLVRRKGTHLCPDCEGTPKIDNEIVGSMRVDKINDDATTARVNASFTDPLLTPSSLINRLITRLSY